MPPIANKKHPVYRCTPRDARIAAHAPHGPPPQTTQILFALIAFAASAWLLNNLDYSTGNWPPVASLRFMVFTGVTAFLISIFYLVVSCVEGLQRTFWGLVEVVINALWALFWMAAAAAFASYWSCKPGNVDFSAFTQCDQFLASQAFAWLSWFMWLGSLVVSIIDMRRGEGITGGPKRYPGVV
jgi:hypothetical protein